MRKTIDAPFAAPAVASCALGARASGRRAGARRHHGRREPGGACSRCRSPSRRSAARRRARRSPQVVDRRPRALGPVPPARSGHLPRAARTSTCSRRSTPGRRSAPRRCWSARSPTGADGRLQRRFPAVGRLRRRPAGRHCSSPRRRRTGARIAHKIADAVYEKLTGEKGYFDTRVVFVAESGPKTHRVTRLAIMDQDGANPSYLTDGSAHGVHAALLRQAPGDHLHGAAPDRRRRST